MTGDATASAHAAPSIRLSGLAARAGLGDPEGDADPEIAAVVEDSRRVTPGALFVALAGSRADGAGYAGEACARGAAALAAAERPLALAAGFPFLPLRAPRADLARLAAAFFGEPARALRLAAVTGTKGKTTTAELMRAVAEAAGEPTAVIGTIGARFGAIERPPGLTTPAAPELHELFAAFRAAGARAVVMEVSSHALTGERVHGLAFDSAVFTNLTPDHLDHHGDVESYFAAKRRLFVGAERAARAAVNLDDARGRELKAAWPEALGFGTDATAAVRLERLAEEPSGLELAVATPLGPLRVRSPLLGRFNAFNLLAAIAWGVLRDFDPAAIARGLETVRAVPGRLERVDAGQGFLAIVDFAHSGAALAAVLEALRPLTRGRLSVVFGCGGNRNPERRRTMGEVARRLADRMLITSDNPRDEEPLAIVADIERAARAAEGAAAIAVEPDRTRAIQRAVAEAEAGDTLLIAGRGHESHQLVRGARIPFDDRVVLRAALDARSRTADASEVGA